MSQDDRQPDGQRVDDTTEDTADDTAEQTPTEETTTDDETEQPTPPSGGGGWSWARVLRSAAVFSFGWLIYFWFTGGFSSDPDPSSVTELYKKLESTEITSVYVEPRPNEMLLVRLTLKSESDVKGSDKDDESEKEGEELSFAAPAGELQIISEMVKEKGLTYETIPAEDLEDAGYSIFYYILLFLPSIVLLVLLSIMRGGVGGGWMRAFNKNAGFKVEPVEHNTTFEDVAGVDHALTEVREVVDFLRNPEGFEKLGARVPRGVLLTGGPGTGKTLLARAVAGEAGVPFFSVSGSEFVQMFVGVGASRFRDLFAAARMNTPSIVFIDEIDAIGRKRSSGRHSHGAHDEREQTLNQLLVELDGFDSRANVIIMAATNRPDILDEALLRAGRFDRSIQVDPPTERGREAILKVHSRKLRLADDVNLALVAQFTMGFVGADLANLCNEAAIFAARAGRHRVTMRDFEDGRDRAVVGIPSNLMLNDPKQKRNTAGHEAGHTVVAHLLKDRGLREPYSTSISPNSNSLGRMHTVPRLELAHVTKDALIVEMAILLAGRGGEKLTGDEDLSAGAADDLRRATAIAMHMVYEYGFGEKVGNRVLRDSTSPSVYDNAAEAHPIGAELQEHADADVKELLDKAQKLCDETLDENKPFHKAVTQRLEDEGSVRGTELEGIRTAAA